MTEVRPADVAEPSAHDPEEAARRLVAITRDLAREVHPHRARVLRATLDASLDRDFGLDSLGRVELWGRLERAFEVRLPESLLSEARTPRDLLEVILKGGARPAAPETQRVLHAAPGVVEPIPESVTTLLEVLEWHVEAHPERTHLVLRADASGEEVISYRGLRDGARRGPGLHARGLGPGESVAIMLPTEPGILRGLLRRAARRRCPGSRSTRRARPTQLEDYLRRQAAILANARGSVADHARRGAAHGGAAAPAGRGCAAWRPSRRCAPARRLPRARRRASDTAFFQYTSGSTGQPKGVLLTHANLLANIRAIGERARRSSADRRRRELAAALPRHGADRRLARLPLLTASRWCSCRRSPSSRRPERWLWAIHRHRGTLSAAPNFAYELCARAASPTRELEGLDLSLLARGLERRRAGEPRDARSASPSASPPYGFRPEAMTPVYGLAECSVGLAFPPLGRGPRSTAIDRDGLRRVAARRSPAGRRRRDALGFVACGRPLPGHEVRIVDDAGRELAERQRGPPRVPRALDDARLLPQPGGDAPALPGGWLDTGDLAYLAGGEHVPDRPRQGPHHQGRPQPRPAGDRGGGRRPAGRPQGLRGGLRQHRSANPDRALVVLPRPARRIRRARRVCAADRAGRHGLLDGPPDEVVLAPPHTVLKTSSGKIRRAACRELFEQGRLGARPRAVWWQVVRLAWAGLAPRLREWRGVAFAFLYAGYWWTLLALIAAVTWLLVFALRDEPARLRVLRAAARTLLRLSGTPLAVEGLAHLPSERCVLVVNHASYIDGLVLLAALPRGCLFVAKKEFERQRVAGPFLRRIGALFVERADPRGGAEDTRRVTEALRRGELPIAFFPEGDLLPHAGLAAIQDGCVPGSRGGGGTRRPRSAEGHALDPARRPVAAATRAGGAAALRADRGERGQLAGGPRAARPRALSRARDVRGARSRRSAGRLLTGASREECEGEARSQRSEQQDDDGDARGAQWDLSLRSSGSRVRPRAMRPAQDAACADSDGERRKPPDSLGRLRSPGSRHFGSYRTRKARSFLLDLIRHCRIWGEATGGGLRRMARRCFLRHRVPEVTRVPSRKRTPCGPAALYFASAHPPSPPPRAPRMSDQV